MVDFETMIFFILKLCACMRFSLSPCPSRACTHLTPLIGAAVPPVQFTAGRKLDVSLKWLKFLFLAHSRKQFTFVFGGTPIDHNQGCKKYMPSKTSIGLECACACNHRSEYKCVLLSIYVYIILWKKIWSQRCAWFWQGVVVNPDSDNL